MNDFALSAIDFVEDIPTSYEDIKGRSDADKWYEACDEEMSSIIKNKTYTLEELPTGKKTINCMWVFRIKENKEGRIFKARLVAKGCSQTKGVDYNEVYAPVARLTTVRILISIINKMNYFTVQMDVKSAFLHGDLNEEIFMLQPPGYVKNPNLVCRLKKSLYGLRQAPRSWNAKLNKKLNNVKFRQSNYDKCLYILKQDNFTAYLLVYVNDLIIAGDNPDLIEDIKISLKSDFATKDLGQLNNFLGIEIEKTQQGIYLNQSAYLRRILDKFGMTDCKPTK